jgi:hypothetical protein
MLARVNRQGFLSKSDLIGCHTSGKLTNDQGGTVSIAEGEGEGGDDFLTLNEASHVASAR